MGKRYIAGDVLEEELRYKVEFMRNWHISKKEKMNDSADLSLKDFGEQPTQRKRGIR